MQCKWNGMQMGMECKWEWTELEINAAGRRRAREEGLPGGQRVHDGRPLPGERTALFPGSVVGFPFMVCFHVSCIVRRSSCFCSRSRVHAFTRSRVHAFTRSRVHRWWFGCRHLPDRQATPRFTADGRRDRLIACNSVCCVAASTGARVRLRAGGRAGAGRVSDPRAAHRVAETI